RDVEVGEGGGTRRRGADVEAQGTLEERREGGLVRVRERDRLVAPTPPLRLAHVRAPFVVDAAIDDTQSTRAADLRRQAARRRRRRWSRGGMSAWRCTRCHLARV